jgi:hypothetical protein
VANGAHFVCFATSSSGSSSGSGQARGHHFAARVNRPQESRSTPRWVERSGVRVSNQPTPGVFGWLRNEAAPVTILDQGAEAPLSISSQTLVGCHRAVHVSAVAAHGYRISPIGGSTLSGSVDGRFHRTRGRWHHQFGDVAHHQPRGGLATTGKTFQKKARCTSNLPLSRMRK